MNSTLINKILRYEQDDDMPDSEVIALFQELIDSGVVWGLQGSYGRMARWLLENRLCTPPRPTMFDIMRSNYTNGVEEKGVATFLHYMSEPDRMALRYHSTDVVIAYLNGDIELDSGGFNVPRFYNGAQRKSTSYFTRTRIARYLPEGISLYQEKYIWWLGMPNGDQWEFVDHMRISHYYYTVKYYGEEDTAQALQAHSKVNVLERLKREQEV